MQRRLILSNLRELYNLFKDKHPEQKIGFSKFAELRCVLAGASGTHAICVCTIHQNMNLMMQSIKLGELTTSNGTSLQTYQHCIAQAICNPPLPICYLGTCNYCPGFASLEEVLRSVLGDNLIDYITFKQWVSVDRSTLDTFSKPADEFTMINSNIHIRLSRHNRPPFSVSVSLLSKPVSCLYRQTSLRTTHLLCKMQYRASTGTIPRQQSILL